MKKWDSIKNIVISERTDVPKSGRHIWFSLKIDDIEYSLMDIGKLMSTNNYKIEGQFLGWETLRTLSNGEHEIIRGGTLFDLLDKLTT